jgi:DNA-binding response OmpR family regulator
MQTRKVAIIDHDEKVIREVKETLALGGYVPVVVTDAHLAVDTVVWSKPDVILLELSMPGKNGFKLNEELSRLSQDKKIPLIAMSDVFTEEFTWLLELCGIKRFLKKPFQPLDLIWAIEHELNEDDQLN